MQTFTVGKEQENKRIDKVLKETFPNMPLSAMYKALRKKDIKVNGTRIKEDYVTSPGDVVEVFIPDNILYGVPMQNNLNLNIGFTVEYEDKNILVVNKEQGIPVHPDRKQSENTLIDLVRSYLEKKGEYNPDDPSSFPPSLCHRLDRNTGGLLIIAKNNESLKIILDKISTREIKKYYQCLVIGKMDKSNDELKAYLIKDEHKSRVFISDKRTSGAVEIITRYKVLSYENNISKLEVELVTGRTHQIRAHLAHIGHPIVGDGKYGSNIYNRPLKAKYQALWAHKIEFDFKNAGILNYLKGKKIEVQPDFKLKLKKHSN